MGVQINGDTGNISATKADYSGNVTIGGTLTYEDVTNIDSVGLVTARSGIEVGARPGVAASISVDGNMIVSGITTIGGDIKVGSGVTIGKDGHLFATGVTTSTTVKVGAAVTISESGIDAVGLGITCANINGGQIGGRRRISINGDMIIAQRATSASVSDGSNEGYSTVDRWYVLHSSSAGGAATWSQDSDVPTDYSWGRFSKSLKADVTTADTSIASNHAITLQYKIEAQDIRNSGWDYTNPNSTLSVSFWAKSVKAGTYCVALHTHDGTVADIVKEYTLVANTWKHVELEFPGNSGLTINNDNGSGLTVLWALQVGSDRQLDAGTTWTTRSGEGKYGSSNQVNFYDSTDNNFYLTGVQIEVGKATIFEHRNFGEELALCQRYFYRHGDLSGTRNYALMGVGIIGHNGSTDAGKIQISAPVRMRTQPTATAIPSGAEFIVGTGGGDEGTSDMYSNSAPALWTSASSDINFWVDFNRSSGGSPDRGIACIVHANNNGANIGFDAEL